MAKLEYITVEKQRAFETFGMLHMVYNHTWEVDPKDDEEKKNKEDMLKVLDELLVYYANRLKIEYERKKEEKEDDETRSI